MHLLLNKNASALTEEDVVNFCKERLAPYKVPTVVFVSSLPKNSVGKVLKNEVKTTSLSTRIIKKAAFIAAFLYLLL